MGSFSKVTFKCKKEKSYQSITSLFSSKVLKQRHFAATLTTILAHAVHSGAAAFDGLRYLMS